MSELTGDRTPSAEEVRRRAVRATQSRRATAIAAASSVLVIGALVAVVVSSPGWDVVRSTFFDVQYAGEVLPPEIAAPQRDPGAAIDQTQTSARQPRIRQRSSVRLGAQMRSPCQAHIVTEQARGVGGAHISLSAGTLSLALRGDGFAFGRPHHASRHHLQNLWILFEHLSHMPQ